jgi:hypothetical protein
VQGGARAGGAYLLISTTVLIAGLELLPGMQHVAIVVVMALVLATGWWRILHPGTMDSIREALMGSRQMKEQ